MNIQRFQALLAETTDLRQRAILARLIDEHEANFRRFATSAGPDAAGDGT